MEVEVIVYVLSGIFIGAWAMFWIQRKNRIHELEEIEKLNEAILDGKTVHAIASGKETLYAKIECQLIRIQEMLQGRKEDAEKSRDEIQKLISEIAHQMRTPLTNIGTYQKFLEEKLYKQIVTGKTVEFTSSLEYIKAMEKSEEKLCFLVEGFIKMSRMEHKLIQIRQEEKDIIQTLRNVLGQIQYFAERKNLQFDITMPDTLVCLHDTNWFGEAIYNLLDNAVKYSENGGRVGMSVYKNEVYLKIQVRDYGIGIRKGEENKIFQRFYRGELVTTQEGFGIGLYLAREIVNQHGGFLQAKRMLPGLQMEIKIPL